MRVEVLTKVCSRCAEEKKLEFFTPRSTAPDGRMGRCKACVAEMKRIRIANDQDLANRLRAENRAFYKKDTPYRRRRYAEKREKYRSDEDYRQKIVAAQKARNDGYWSDPNWVASKLDEQRERYRNDPEFREECKARRKDYTARKAVDREFDAFMERMEAEAAEYEASNKDE